MPKLMIALGAALILASCTNQLTVVQTPIAPIDSTEESKSPTEK